MIKTLCDSILSLVCPQECSICHGQVESADDGVACTDCWNATRIFNGRETLCSKCGAFLFGANPPHDHALCRKCEGHHYDRAVAVGIYEKALSASVLRLKLIPHIPNRLKRLIGTMLGSIPIDDSAVVVPVPLSSRRRRERGFNQAAVIGRIVSKHAGITFDENSLIRKIHTPMHRAGMDKKARAMTVKNAFAVVRPKLIVDRRVLLVDDIFTSGETASTCAKVLKESGASMVNVFTIARTA
jgi:ComF family protein